MAVATAESDGAAEGVGAGDSDFVHAVERARAEATRTTDRSDMQAAP
jgi:hypothetical protein